jgi:hypothetical protein
MHINPPFGCIVMNKPEASAAQTDINIVPATEHPAHPVLNDQTATFVNKGA